MHSLSTFAGRLRAASIAAAASMFLVVSSASAGTFQVDPVNIILPADRPVAKFMVKNISSLPVSLRVTTYDWEQQGGEDVYSETRQVIVSPPIFTIPAGRTQLVRVGLKSSKDGEQAFRVILEEIPRPLKDQTGIHVAVRMNLPIYKLPAGKGTSDLQWSASRDRNGELLITALNQGSLHEQVVELAAVTPAGVTASLSNKMGVVLPGRKKTWRIGHRPGLADARELQLLVRGPGGESKTTVQLVSR
jgi:fimbrial chaperone protein